MLLHGDSHVEIWTLEVLLFVTVISPYPCDQVPLVSLPLLLASAVPWDTAVWKNSLKNVRGNVPSPPYFLIALQ